MAQLPSDPTSQPASRRAWDPTPPSRRGRPAWTPSRSSARGRLSGRHRAQRRAGDPMPPAEIEPVAGRQRMQDDVADHQRPVAADLPGVRLGVSAVDDRDAAAPDDVEDRSGPTTPAVSSSTPSPSSYGFWAMSASSRPSRFRCWKCWSMITLGSIPRPAAIWAMRCLGVAPLAPNATMWLLIARRTGARAGNDRACPERSQRWPAPRRVPPIVDESRSWLPPVRKIAARVAHRAAPRSVIGLRARGRRASGAPRAAPSSPKTLAIQLAGFRAQRRGRADHGDGGVAATGERDEPAEDDPVADLVLRAADDDDGSFGHEQAHPERAIRPGQDTKPGARPRSRSVRRMRRYRTMDQGNAPRTVPGWPQAGLIDRPTRRRAGRLAPRAARPGEGSADPRRVLAILLIAVVGGFFAAGLIARGEAAGADARAYWAGVRIWLNGGDPYHPTGRSCRTSTRRGCCRCSRPGRCCRGTSPGSCGAARSCSLLLWTIHWAYRQRPLATAVVAAALAFPIAANLDTGQHHARAWRCCSGRRSSRDRAWPACSGPSRRGSSGFPRPSSCCSPRAPAHGACSGWASRSCSASPRCRSRSRSSRRSSGSASRPIRLDYLVLLWATRAVAVAPSGPLWWIHPRAGPSDAAGHRGDAAEPGASAGDRIPRTRPRRGARSPAGPRFLGACATCPRAAGAGERRLASVSACSASIDGLGRDGGRFGLVLAPLRDDPPGAARRARTSAPIATNAARGPLPASSGPPTMSMTGPRRQQRDRSGAGGRDVADAHVPARRGLRDDVGHEGPVDRQERARRRRR